HYRSWLKAARLSRLLPQDEAAANRWLTRLKYSRSESQAICRVLNTQAYVERLVVQEGYLDRADEFFMFKSAGASFPAVSLVALSSGVPVESVINLVKRYQDADDAIAHPSPLVSGKDLMGTLGLKSGPHIGRLLSAIEQAQAQGIVTNAQEALAWAQDWADQP
ncbi:MAG: CCA tRNA nucleotidyltransferase, partial [Cyanobacteria bacterium J06642_11]